MAQQSPPFVFNHRTGDLVREGRMIALCRLHAEIFACLAAAQGPIATAAIARAVNMPLHSVENEMPALAARIKRLGILIARSLGRGRYLQFEEVPKWKPNIPEPVRLEGDTR